MDWKRIIVGDAFKLPSRNPRYYLDLVLMVRRFLIISRLSAHLCSPRCLQA
jgi:hypothetical protein